MTTEEIEEIRERYRELPYSNPSREDIKDLLADVKTLLDEVEMTDQLTPYDVLVQEQIHVLRVENERLRAQVEAYRDMLRRAGVTEARSQVPLTDGD